MAMDMNEDYGSCSSSEGSEEHDDDVEFYGPQGTGEGESDNDTDSSDDEEEENMEPEVDEDTLKQQLSEVKNQLAADPYSYDLHVSKITLLRKLGDLEELRQGREAFRLIYPLSEQLWMEWVQDEVKVACTDEEKNFAFTIFDHAVEDYLSINVWLEYLKFCLKELDTENGQQRCRDVFERALSAGGLHASCGSLIWDMYRSFEAAMLGLSTTDDERRTQENRLLAVCRRQLSVPLLGMDSTYEEVKGQFTIDANTESAYQTALSKAAKLEPWEAKLVQAADTDKIKVYQAYIADEKKGKSNPARIQCLYERAVLDFPLYLPLWNDYLDYLSKNLKISNIVLRTAHRATRNCTGDLNLWIKHMQLVEAFETKEDYLEALKKVFEVALSYCFAGEQVGTLWLKYLESLKRQSNLSDPPEKILDILKRTFSAADQHLVQLLPDPNIYMLEILLFQVSFEAQSSKGITEEVTNMWRQIMSRGYGCYCRTWIAQILQETKYRGDVPKIRSLYSKALSHVKDDFKLLSHLWTSFERDNGDLASMDQCEKKILNVTCKQEETSSLTDIDTSNRNSSKFPQSQVTIERKPASNKNESVQGRKRKINGSESASDSSQSQAKKGRANEDVVDADSSSNGLFKVPALPLEDKKSASKPAAQKQDTHGEPLKHDHSKDNRTLFISNLAYTTVENQIEEFFKDVGQVEEIRLVKDYKERSKGFAYVLFSKVAEAKAGLLKDRQPLGGRPAFVSKCDPDKSTRRKEFKYSTNLEKNKLFIKGLPFSMTVDELRDIFKVHGDLKDCRLVTYRNGHSKGLAYVEYQDEVCATQAILKADGMEIGDKKISVALSNPPVRDPSKSSSSGSFSKSSSGESLQRRTPKPFVPRALQISTSTKKNDDPTTSSSSNSSAPKSNQDFRKMFLK